MSVIACGETQKQRERLRGESERWKVKRVPRRRRERSNPRQLAVQRSGCMCKSCYRLIADRESRKGAFRVPGEEEKRRRRRRRMITDDTASVNGEVDRLVCPYTFLSFDKTACNLACDLLLATPSRGPSFFRAQPTSEGDRQLVGLSPCRHAP
ncbi:hypothetical protein AAT19DRAFT_14851 [Rhodotorula toruloides]|uniref:Uncharacterized protein n=1 Tax=Rhodotorula toruloides TaxID=5286 RepID=A0A2T0A915_RHOTO|nr:hypothetical protein AAT19DRAFT_14851 [Rhodotorula toruloides]